MLAKSILTICSVAYPKLARKPTLFRGIMKADLISSIYIAVVTSKVSHISINKFEMTSFIASKQLPTYVAFFP